MLQHFSAKKHNIYKIMRHRHLDSAGIVLIFLDTKLYSKLLRICAAEKY
jgi:hypothetical protein